MIDPYISNPSGQIDLWDSHPLDARRTTAIGYRPGVHGSCRNALVLFEQTTGVDPRFGASEQAAQDLGISPGLAVGLRNAAALTVAADGAALPEPASIAILGVAAAVDAG